VATKIEFDLRVGNEIKKRIIEREEEF